MLLYVLGCVFEKELLVLVSFLNLAKAKLFSFNFNFWRIECSISLRKVLTK
eukprot:TRINITY_DN3245_c2_g1_i1.p2 TRINITY_DN3245_c2_g1~~TRINITY_DN3245_c2_g1_i1.p2  ORF type:complete len:51 (-),score=7.96 TRINITY_DN3245_c2_g1_i1:405-557(-)